MITVPVVPLSLLVAHFVGDFLLQSDWMATNKSKSSDALLTHCLVYSLCFLYMGPLFAFATFALHGAVDCWTSRLTSKLWFFQREAGIWEQASYVYPKHGQTLVNPWSLAGGNRHWFFVAIGFDQLLHFAALAATLHWL